MRTYSIDFYGEISKFISYQQIPTISVPLLKDQASHHIKVSFFSEMAQNTSLLTEAAVFGRFCRTFFVFRRPSVASSPSMSMSSSSYCEKMNLFLYPLATSGLLHPYQLEESISNFRGVNHRSKSLHY